MEKVGMKQDSSEVQSVTRSWKLAEFAGRKVRPGLRWMALAAFLALGPVGGTMAAGLSDVSSHGNAQVAAQVDSSPGGVTPDVRKSGPKPEEYPGGNMRKSGGDPQFDAGVREIIAI